MITNISSYKLYKMTQQNSIYITIFDHSLPLCNQMFFSDHKGYINLFVKAIIYDISVKCKCNYLYYLYKKLVFYQNSLWFCKNGDFCHSICYSMGFYSDYNMNCKALHYHRQSFLLCITLGYCMLVFLTSCEDGTFLHFFTKEKKKLEMIAHFFSLW